MSPTPPDQSTIHEHSFKYHMFQLIFGITLLLPISSMGVFVYVCITDFSPLIFVALLLSYMGMGISIFLYSKLRQMELERKHWKIHGTTQITSGNLSVQASG